MPRPYLFTRQFGPDATDPDATPAQPQLGGFTEEDLSAVRDRAFRQGIEVGERDGFERGRGNALQSVEAQTAQALTQLDAAVRQAADRLATVEQRVEQEAVRVVAALIRKLAPPLLDLAAEVELDRLVVDALRAAAGLPNLVLRLPPEAAERMRPQLERLGRDTGFRGGVEVKADPALPRGHAVADWGEGLAERDPRRIERQLDDAVAIAIGRLTPRPR